MNNFKKHFVVGDTHGNIDFSKIYNWKPEDKDEKILFQLGDWGSLFHNPSNNKDYLKDQKLLKQWIKHSKRCNFTLCVIPGNHENYGIIDKLPIIDKWGGKVQLLEVYHHYTKVKLGEIFLLMRGEIYIIDGIKYFVMGGANSVDRNNRIENVDWWSRELPNYAETNNAYNNFKKHNMKVDVMLTHTCNADTVYNCLSYKVGVGTYGSSPNLDKIDDSLTRFFNQLSKDVDFKQWHFGHVHYDGVITHLEDDRYYESHYNGFPKEIIL
jgi:hypothetical protein